MKEQLTINTDTQENEKGSFFCFSKNTSVSCESSDSELENSRLGRKPGCVSCPSASCGSAPALTLSLVHFFRTVSNEVVTITQELFFGRNFGETKKLRKSWGRGFTLVEMIIYTAIFSFLSIVAVNGIIVTMKSFYAIRLAQNINQSATAVMERMTYEIRNAYDIDTANSTFGSSPGHITLMTKDAGGGNTTVEFYVLANQLNMRVGGIDQGSLMVKTSTLTNLVFRSIANSNSKAIKIEMTVLDSRQDLTNTAKFYDTIILRGSLR